MVCPPHPPEPLVEDWLERHRNPVSFALHLAGIPATILGTMLIPVYLALWSPEVFLLALAFFVGGFAIQFLGHALELTEPGEIAGLRNWAKKQWSRGRGAASAQAGGSRSLTPGSPAAGL